jgi:holliday junction resolvase YEN1
MGISGLWDELSPASTKRRNNHTKVTKYLTNCMLALTRLSVQHYERTGRLLRVAIDISIWSFQIQSGRQGSNPSLRTFYYRLCHLLSTPLHPLFIFDGPRKPPFKRNVRTFVGADTFQTRFLKRLITVFGFVWWDAPGEAEAECAVLQRRGTVDVVVTEDVDAVMFGAGKVAREVGGTGSGGKREWVVYEDVEAVTGLDRDGLVLCAMMSGGDYLPQGVPNCGPKIAVEVVSLCYLNTLPPSRFNAWLMLGDRLPERVMASS